jgi:protein-disulfide isomerase
MVMAVLTLLTAVSVAQATDHPTGPSLGPADAPVTVVLYYDFQCSYCGLTAPVLLDVVKQYDGLVKFVTVNVPGPGHSYALPAAEFALTANDSGKFWEAYTLLFANQDKLAIDDLIGYAKMIGMSQAQVQKNLEEMVHKEELKANLYKALDIGLTATPTVFIGQEKLVGVQDADNLRRHINDALKKQGIKSPVSIKKNTIVPGTILNERVKHENPHR